MDRLTRMMIVCLLVSVWTSAILNNHIAVDAQIIMRGYTGATGFPGPSGYTGSTGPRGEEGPLGEAGSPGEEGPTGPTGPIGETGVRGPLGPMGPAGSMGGTGATGVEGPPGPIGDPGVPGADGFQGGPGPTGATGGSGLRGPLGPPGSAGPRGPSGSVGPTGPNGATGFTGPEGVQGPAGFPGPQGPPGNGSQISYVFCSTSLRSENTCSFDEPAKNSSTSQTTDVVMVYLALVFLILGLPPAFHVTRRLSRKLRQLEERLGPESTKKNSLSYSKTKRMLPHWSARRQLSTPRDKAPPFPGTCNPAYSGGGDLNYKDGYMEPVKRKASTCTYMELTDPDLVDSEIYSELEHAK